MNIDPAHGLIWIFMVQQDGPWGTSQGDAISPTLERFARALVVSQ